jgi:dolichol-phosphate mannosyltransferase
MAVQMLEPTRRAIARDPAAPRTLVVLPTYNEADNIAEVLERTRSMLPGAAILVVDDASPDGTAERVEAVGRRLGAVSVLRRPQKLGLGSAYRDGFRRGLDEGYEVLVEMDADLSHDPVMLPDLVRAVTDGADLAIGSRYVPGGSVPGWPWWRQAISRTGGAYARVMLRVPVADATSGFRAFRAATLEAVDLDHMRADGYGFQVEMAYRVHTVGGSITEIPIAFRDRTRGRSKMSMRIVVEALLLVTRWGVRDRIFGSRSRDGGAATRPRPAVGAADR